MPEKSAIEAMLARLYHPALPGIELGLARVRTLLAALGNPQDRLPPVIHVAGTNGKGSTIAYLRAMYQAAGKRVHVYSSPHLVRFNERIVLAGTEITDAQLLPYLKRFEEASREIPVTFFEATTAAAFLAFAQHAADVVLLETGLGGRLDATNMVARPICTAITPIGYDHMEFLGDTLAAIAREKAGIMKSGVPCISAPQEIEAEEVLRAHAKTVNAPFFIAPNDWQYTREANRLQLQFQDEIHDFPLPNLLGEHQQLNAALAATIALKCRDTLPIHAHAIAEGVQTAQWPARLQRLTQGPLVQDWHGDVYLDGGHNAHAARVLAQWAGAQPQKPVMICAMLQRKAALEFFHELAPVCAAMACIPMPADEPGYTPQQLADFATQAGFTHVQMATSSEAALQQLQAYRGAPVLIGGSLYLAGEILKNHG